MYQNPVNGSVCIMYGTVWIRIQIRIPRFSSDECCIIKICKIVFDIFILLNVLAAQMIL
jgi:hypothetical protein